MIFYGVAVAFFTFNLWTLLGEPGLDMELELGFLTSAKEILAVDKEYRMMMPTHGSTGHLTYFAVGSCEGKDRFGHLTLHAVRLIFGIVLGCSPRLKNNCASYSQLESP